MVLIVTREFVFIAVPRTASQSIARYLCKRDRRALVLWPHHRLKIPEEHLRKRIFCVVRNPFTRLPSMYAHRLDQAGSEEQAREHMETFTSWMTRFVSRTDDSWYRNQSEFLQPVRNRIATVIRFEELEVGLHRLGLRSFDVRVNSSKRKIRIGREEADLILRHSLPDFEQFGYSKTWSSIFQPGH